MARDLQANGARRSWNVCYQARLMLPRHRLWEWSFRWPYKRYKKTNVPRSALMPSNCIRTEAATFEDNNKETFSCHSCQKQHQEREGTRDLPCFSSPPVNVSKWCTSIQQLDSFHLTHCDAPALSFYTGWQYADDSWQVQQWMSPAIFVFSAQISGTSTIWAPLGFQAKRGWLCAQIHVIKKNVTFSVKV